MSVACLLATLVPSGDVGAGEAQGRLCFRQTIDGKWQEVQHPIIGDAVEVFTYEGQPRGVRVIDGRVAVDYGLSGVLFDAAGGQFVKRYTVADGWPAVRPDQFGPAPEPSPSELVGPGVLWAWRPPATPTPEKSSPAVQPAVDPEVVAEVEFGGRAFQARQPRRFLQDLGKGLDWRQQSERFGRWTAILKSLDQQSYVHAGPESSGRRYTVADGLASNLVTHLAVARGALWAACVDIYEEEKNDWGPGGLCRFEPEKDRWVRIDEINGRPVRWVTLLETIENELWVGFREGRDIAGDSVVYGMGLYPGHYRPHSSSIVLARLKRGQWSTWSREPREDFPRQDGPERPKPEPPTEVPRSLAVIGDQVLLYSTTRSDRVSGNWVVPLDGQLSRLDLGTGRWQLFDVDGDLGTHRLLGLHAEAGQAIAVSETGAHQWDRTTLCWRLLDSGCALKNPQINAATPVGDELWVGYTAQDFWRDGVQGISRFRETTGQWTYMSPDELGTSCQVGAIVAGPNQDVWVLFRWRLWMTASARMATPEVPTTAEAKAGVGRFAHGKWTFPVELPGVPKTVEIEVQGRDGPEKRPFPAPVQQIACVGDELFVANRAGVFAGPGTWRKIIPSKQPRGSFFEEPVVEIEPSDDGRTLVVTRFAGQDQAQQEIYERGHYDPKTGKVTFQPVKREELDWDVFYDRMCFLSYYNRQTVDTDWVEVPVNKPGQWCVGPIPSDYQGYHRVVESPQAVWIASPGQLVRLDRKRLREWLRSR